MPRYNLRRVRDDFVRPFCEKWGVHYQSGTFFEVLGNVLRQLRDVADHANGEMEE